MCDQLSDVYRRYWNPDNGDINITGWPSPCTQVLISRDGMNVAGWEVFHSPGVVLIHNAWVLHKLRGTGLGQQLAKFRVDCFKALKGDCQDIEMICRVAPDNAVQHHILRKLGWKQLSSTIWQLE